MTDILTAAAVLLAGALIVTTLLLAVLAQPWQRRDNSPAREQQPAAYWLWDDTDGWQSWVGINTPAGARPPAWDGEDGQRVPHSPTAGMGEKR